MGESAKNFINGLGNALGLEKAQKAATPTALPSGLPPLPVATIASAGGGQPAAAPDVSNPAALAPPGLADIYDSQLLGQQPAAPLGVNPLAAQDNAYGPNVANTPAEFASDLQDKPVAIEGDSFKPKKLSVLEQVADVFLYGSLGRKNYRQNLEKAMDGITNPNEPRSVEKAINRVRQFDPKLAMGMFQKHVDDKRADAAAKMLEQTRKLQVMAPLRSQLGEILKNGDDAPRIYQELLPQLRNQRDQSGLSEDDVPLPDEWNSAGARNFYRGGILPKDTERLEDSDQRIAQKDRSLDQADEKIDQTDRRIDISERQGDDRIGIARQNANTSAGESNRKDRNDNTLVVKEQIKDKNGKTITKEQKYRNGAVVPEPGGKRAFKNENGIWVLYLKNVNGRYYKAKKQ